MTTFANRVHQPLIRDIELIGCLTNDELYNGSSAIRARKPDNTGIPQQFVVLDKSTGLFMGDLKNGEIIYNIDTVGGRIRSIEMPYHRATKYSREVAFEWLEQNHNLWLLPA